ncbi:MAG TPA: hypothetical protein VK908_12050 [Jiangellales bacterium]|nr:hypothetical protein [Jiangellales bacterium]
MSAPGVAAELWEDPWALRGRLALGREEFCQRLITTLIVGGRYRRWNTASEPSADSLLFLRALRRLAGLGPLPACVFVDEFELPARSDDETGGAPDWAVLWPGHLWIIELKTEAASHRPGQLAGYATLGRHHHPDRAIELTYLTPSLRSALDAVTDVPLTHLLWSDVTPLLDEVWGSASDPRVRAVVGHAVDMLQRLDRPPRDWRAESGPDAVAAGDLELPRVDASPPVRGGDGDADDIGRALALAHATAADGKQRALETELPSLEDLHVLRKQIRDAICSSPTTDVRRVRPWLWSVGRSTGVALTQSGERDGYEIRLSRYREPVC